MELKLRAAMPGDAGRLSELLDQLGWTVTPEQVVNNLRTAPDVEVVVAELDRMVVGLIVFVTRRLFHRAGDVTFVDTLVVDEDHRSRGIGEELIAAAVEAADQRGAQALELASHVRRVDARRFYERLGFVAEANYFVRLR